MGGTFILGNLISLHIGGLRLGIQFSKLLEARQEEVAAQAWIAGHTPCGHWYPKRLAKQAVSGYHHEIAMDFEGVYNQTSLVRGSAIGKRLLSSANIQYMGKWGGSQQPAKFLVFRSRNSFRRPQFTLQKNANLLQVITYESSIIKLRMTY